MLAEFKKAASAFGSRARLRHAEGIRTSHLANGIEVVTHNVPSIAHPLEGRYIDFTAEVQVGRSHEKDAYTHGISHLYEHVALGPSAHVSAVDLGDGTIPRYLGTFNASTSLDATVYEAVVHPKSRKPALFALSDKVCRPTFSPGFLETEKRLIEAERIDAQAQPAKKTMALGQSIAFGAAPHHHDVLGLRDTIQSISLEELQRFRNEYYRSGQVVIAAEGPVRHEEVVKLVKEWFQLPVGERKPPVMHEYRGGYAERAVAGNEGATISLGFNCPTDADHPAIHVAGLAHGLSPVLNKAFRESGLAYRVDTSSNSEGNITMLTIRYTTAVADAEKSISLVRDVLDQTMNGPTVKAPGLHDWLAHPLQMAKTLRPGYRHAYSDLLFHPLRTAQALLRNRVERRGAKNLAHDLMRKGEIPSANRDLHAFLATTEQDKANMVRRMRQFRVSVLVEGNVSGFPDYGHIREQLELPTGPVAATPRRQGTSAPTPERG
ncbi:MAG: insulinase family protein [Pseudomonadota bacterium]|nr:insulinase family protein [Pseudomonadota bacterium]